MLLMAHDVDGGVPFVCLYDCIRVWVFEGLDGSILSIGELWIDLLLVKVVEFENNERNFQNGFQITV